MGHTQRHGLLLRHWAQVLSQGGLRHLRPAPAMAAHRAPGPVCGAAGGAVALGPGMGRAGCSHEQTNCSASCRCFWAAKRPEHTAFHNAFRPINKQTAELEAEVAQRQEELRQVTASHAVARHEAEAALEAERQHRQGLSIAKKREWQSHNALTQLTQAPPPELTAATQADGDEAAQVEIWQV